MLTATGTLSGEAVMSSAQRSHLPPQHLAQQVGLQRWQVERADAAGMLPPRADPRGWLPEQVEMVRALVPAVPARFGTQHPLGTARCAAQLATRLGVEVQAGDIEALAEAGHLQVVEVFESRGRSYELFSPDAVDGLAAQAVGEVIAARLGWTAASVSFEQACERLGWRRDELELVVAERGISRGRFGRLPREVIDGLVADPTLAAQILAERLITADQAADRLDLARRHLDIAVEAGWLVAARYWPKQVGRYKTVEVALYRTGDVDALLHRPDMDWDQVRTTGKGERSPLLGLVGHRTPTRARLVREFLREFGAEHRIEMWGWWLNTSNRWEIDWERLDGGPTRDHVAAAIGRHPGLDRHSDDIVLHPAAGAAIRFARAMLEPGRAIILDTETTDLYGAICEIAVIDAATGATLLDTLVNPGVPIEPGAFAVHGITDADVTAAGVPDWGSVYRRLLRVTKDRTMLAYNAGYDRSVIVADCARAGIARTRLDQAEHWADVMLPRADHAHTRRWLPNAGGHRALADVAQTRQHLLRMTAP
jgi:DNA polymerase III epsilon subunit-like protein